LLYADNAKGVLAIVQLGWWRGVAVTRCVLSTKLVYAGPG